MAIPPKADIVPPTIIAKKKAAIKRPISPSSCEGFVTRPGLNSSTKPSRPPAMVMIMNAIQNPITYHTMDIRMIFTAVSKDLPQETMLEHHDCEGALGISGFCHRGFRYGEPMNR